MDPEVKAASSAWPPTGDRWLSEIKHDGYRVQAQIDGGRALSQENVMPAVDALAEAHPASLSKLELAAACGLEVSGMPI